MIVTVTRIEKDEDGDLEKVASVTEHVGKTYTTGGFYVMVLPASRTVIRIPTADIYRVVEQADGND